MKGVYTRQQHSALLALALALALARSRLDKGPEAPSASSASDNSPPAKQPLPDAPSSNGAVQRSWLAQRVL